MLAEVGNVERDGPGSNVSDDEYVGCGGVISKQVAWWEGEVRWWRVTVDDGGEWRSMLVQVEGVGRGDEQCECDVLPGVVL